MMARPRQYSSAAAKQAAYRQRLVATTAVVDRRALEQLQARLERLQGAIYEAAQQGDTLARQCHAASVETMLDKLIVAFQHR